MKVAIINRSDLRGGAAVFTYRLMQALRQEGVEATMLVCDAMGHDAHVVDYARPLLDKYHFLAERLQIFCNNGFSRENLFKVDTADWGRDLSSHPVVRDADVVILNWVNQGALSLDSIARICRSGKPVVWTMHDMWNCTGICHHAYDCERFRQSCGACVYLASQSSTDLSHRTWRKKKALYAMPNLHFVSVSNWLADKCRESSLLADKRVEVIPNTMPVDSFAYERKPNADMGLQPNVKVLAMGAARLDDPVKGFDILIDTTRYIREQRPQLADKLHLVLFGGIRDASLLQRLALPYTHLGAIRSEAVADVMAHADVVLSTSLYESFGGTLIEGQAAGCVPVTFGNGGQRDIVDHLRTGYIAQYKSCEDVANGIEWAVTTPVDRALLHDEVVSRFSPRVVARRYINYLASLL
ncbi:MAG: glycosyltransferase [Bacteroidaceae bacterium]|nr:glycosyltransferase [Bacteroidaceae bacterium]